MKDIYFYRSMVSTIAAYFLLLSVLVFFVFITGIAGGIFIVMVICLFLFYFYIMR